MAERQRGDKIKLDKEMRKTRERREPGGRRRDKGRQAAGVGRQIGRIVFAPFGKLSEA